jgi:hypothetical protein
MSFRSLQPAEAWVRARAVRVRIVVDIVLLGQVFLRIVLCSPVSIVPPMLSIHLCIIWGMDSGPFSSTVSRRHSMTPSQQYWY